MPTTFLPCDLTTWPDELLREIRDEAADELARRRVLREAPLWEAILTDDAAADAFMRKEVGLPWTRQQVYAPHRLNPPEVFPDHMRRDKRCPVVMRASKINLGRDRSYLGEVVLRYLRIFKATRPAGDQTAEWIDALCTKLMCRWREERGWDWGGATRALHQARERFAALGLYRRGMKLVDGVPVSLARPVPPPIAEPIQRKTQETHGGKLPLSEEAIVFAWENVSPSERRLLHFYNKPGFVIRLSGPSDRYPSGRAVFGFEFRWDGKPALKTYSPPFDTDPEIGLSLDQAARLWEADRRRVRRGIDPRADQEPRKLVHRPSRVTDRQIAQAVRELGLFNGGSE